MYKKIQILLAMTLAVAGSYGQTWTKDIDTSSPNFFAIQKAFYRSYQRKKDQYESLTLAFVRANKRKARDTTSNREIEGEDGDYIRVKRWEYFWSQRVGKRGRFPPNDILLKVSERMADTHAAVSETGAPRNAAWEYMGPVSSTGKWQVSSGVGRVSCVAFHPTLPETFWVGTPAGGLWKTTDGGNTWSTGTDYLPVLGISDIALDPNDPATLYIATGDGDNSFSFAPGPFGGDTKSVGVLKSTDGGTTWKVTGLSWSLTSQNLIRRLIIDPKNPQVLIAAASDGIWRTDNGGITWNNTMDGWFIDILFHPTDDRIVYATTFSSFGDAKVYRSTDNGLSWQPTTLSSMNRIKLAVSPASPALVGALCVDTATSVEDLGGLKGIWFSSDTGKTFNEVFKGTYKTNLLSPYFNGSGCCGQGIYDLAFAINPQNAGEVFVGGVNTWKSADSGKHWVINNFWDDNKAKAPAGVQLVHADKHWITYHPLLKGTLYECNDGGLYKSADDGKTWTDLSKGLGISEIYRISVSSAKNAGVLCGLQDNGSKQFSAGKWINKASGDGMECIIDPDNPQIEYHSYYDGYIEKTIDGGQHWRTIVNTNEDNGLNAPGGWVTPYVMHPTDHNILLVGKDQVYQSRKAGRSWEQLGIIEGNYGNIRSIAYAPSSPATIYVAYDSVLFGTTNGGEKWEKLFTSEKEVITYIAVSPVDPLKLWITFSGYTPGTKVYGSVDGGMKWTNCSGTLANIPVNCIVYSKASPDQLYIGTDLGVYCSAILPKGADWVSFNKNLPHVIVNELEISKDNTLWAATFGRGLWKIDLSSEPPLLPPGK